MTTRDVTLRLTEEEWAAFREKYGYATQREVPPVVYYDYTAETVLIFVFVFMAFFLLVAVV